MRPLTACWIAGFTLLAQTPQPLAHFHHLHLHVTDPKAAIDFYTTKLECEQREFAGAQAVWAHKSWLLFTKVSTPPKSEITSAIWHMGWGEYAGDLSETGG